MTTFLIQDDDVFLGCRHLLVDLHAIEGDSHLEASCGWPRFDGDGAEVLADYALNEVQAEAQPRANGLGGEEGLEDARFERGIEARAAVPNFNDDHSTGKLCSQFEGSAVAHGVKSVFDEGRPHLIEFAAEGADGR